MHSPGYKVFTKTHCLRSNSDQRIIIRSYVMWCAICAWYLRHNKVYAEKEENKAPKQWTLTNKRFNEPVLLIHNDIEH